MPDSNELFIESTQFHDLIFTRRKWLAKEEINKVNWIWFCNYSVVHIGSQVGGTHDILNESSLKFYSKIMEIYDIPWVN